MEPPLPDESPDPVAVIRTYVDEHGRTVRVFPPGYAEGAEPQPSVRCVAAVEMET